MKKSIRALIVDNDPDIREVLRTFLERQVCDGDEAEAGTEGLQLLRKNTYDVILLDLKMPYLDGLEFMEQARLIDVQVPCIMISGHFTTDDVLRAFRLGVVDIISKPVKPVRFLEVLDDVLLRQEESKQSVDISELSTEQRLRRAKYYIQRRRFDEARSLLVTLVDHDDSYSEAHMLAALISEIRGDYSAAENEYKKTLLSFSKDNDSQDWLALAPEA
ncbi:MAG: response regulator [Verrucomicrobiota bacterium]